jgi:hypothetical protein
VSGTGDQGIEEVLVTLLSLLAVTYALLFLIRWLRRSRSELSIGVPIAAAFVLRVAAAIAISLIGVDELRGPDEEKFIRGAEGLSQAPFLSDPWLGALSGDLHEFVLGLQLYALDSPELALRIVHIGIAVAGIALLAAAVYELAGPRVAMVVGWLLALEPTNVFYSEVLHKEANMILGAGLVAFGGATLWRRGDPRYLLPIVLGCLIAATTRSYAGAFLVAAGAALSLHAWIRHRPPGHRLLAVACTVMFVVAVVIPLGWSLTDNASLERLQVRQEAATSDAEANLPLEPVDFSNRQGIVQDVPRRIRDVLFRPYPWQLESTKQQIGLFGTLVVLATLLWLLRELVRNRGRIMDRAGPFVYVGFFLLIAYSLSAANAGTAFRYRTQLEAIAICLIVVLIQDRLRERRAAPTSGRHQRAEPVLAG